MSDNPLNTNAQPPGVLVHLLDPSFGRTVQTWRFDAKAAISIGRAEDRDVAITDPYVSRMHAELQYKDSQWVLISHGRNGVIVKNQSITELPVRDEVTFRLGPSGPTLRFQIAGLKQESLRTLSFDTTPVFLFRLDEDKIQREANEIAAGDYFQTLQQKAKELRTNRQRT